MDKELITEQLAGLAAADETIEVQWLYGSRARGTQSESSDYDLAVGVSKHFLKKNGAPVPSEARTAIEWVYERSGMADPAISSMRGAIGMRNVIIHDYLNIDWGKIETVLATKKYHNVKAYVDYVSDCLIKD